MAGLSFCHNSRSLCRSLLLLAVAVISAAAAVYCVTSLGPLLLWKKDGFHVHLSMGAASQSSGTIGTSVPAGVEEASFLPAGPLEGTSAESVAQLQAHFKQHPLADWIEGDDNMSCLAYEFGTAGIGSELNSVIWGAALLRAKNPGFKMYLGHAGLPLQDSGCAQGLQDLFQLGSAMFPLGPAPTACQRWNKDQMYPFIARSHYNTFFKYVGFKNTHTIYPNANFTLLLESEINMPYNARLRFEKIWRAMWGSLCPVVNDLWQLAPEVQQRLASFKADLRSTPSKIVVAVHPRGGDKLMAEVPKNFDYTFTRGIATVAIKLAHASNEEPTDYPACVLVSDDAKMLDQVHKDVERLLNCSHVVKMPPGGSLRPFWTGGSMAIRGATCQLLRDMVMHIDLLAWANFTVGTMWSNFDAVAYYVAMCKYNRTRDSYVDGSAVVYGPMI